MTDDVTVTRSSGNVFADLGLQNSEEELVKARLVVEIRNRIESLAMSQTAAAKLSWGLLSLTKLLKGRVTGFSLDRLFLGFIRALGTDVEIKLEAIQGQAGRPYAVDGGLIASQGSSPPPLLRVFITRARGFESFAHSAGEGLRAQLQTSDSNIYALVSKPSANDPAFDRPAAAGAGYVWMPRP